MTETEHNTLLSACLWAADTDTAYPPLKHKWKPDARAEEHCGAFAFVVNALYGGEIMSGMDSKKVRWLWNRLPDGRQFILGPPPPETVYGKPVQWRTVSPRYAKFASRVLSRLEEL